MKASILFAALVLVSVSSSAQASWYQTLCTTADGTVTTSNGHNRNQTVVTKRVYDNNGPKEIKIVDEKRLIQQAEGGKNTQILHEAKQHCDGDKSHDGIGWWSNRSVYAIQTQLVNRDGSLFDKDIVGVSKDLKSIEVILLCDQQMNGMAPCPKK